MPVASAGASFSYKHGYGAALQLLQAPDRPEALFCANDILALGAMDAARRECGLRVPEDLSIIGFDDIELASWPAYDLTTIRQPVDRMIASAIDLAIRLSRDRSEEPSAERLPGQLIERSTTREAA